MQISSKAVDMASFGSKHEIRMAKRKKQLAALLEIRRLNEIDRNARSEQKNVSVNNKSPREEPSLKRQRVETIGSEIVEAT